MIVQQFALWMMIALGLGTGAACILIVMRKGRAGAADPRWKPILMGVFSFGLCGVGGFGPSFLGDYSKFLKDLASLGGEEQAERYAKFVDDMGSGKMPEEYQPIARAYMLEHPSANLEATIDQGIAGSRPEHRESLVRLRTDLHRKNETATLAAKAAIAAPAAEGAQPIQPV